MPDLVHITVEGPVATVTIDNPPVNSMSDGVLTVLVTVFSRLHRDPKVRSIVLTGAGERTFVAGGSLDGFAAMLDEPERLSAYLALARQAMTEIAKSPQPVVAAVQASAFGGGLEMAMACDLIVADERAELGLPETQLGLIPGAGGTQRLPRLIGALRAKEMILLGRRISAGEAHAFGLVNEVAAAGTTLAVAVAMAGKIAALPGVAISAAKRAIGDGADLPLADALDVERDHFRSAIAGADAREGITAFLARRPPTFNRR
jgi:enoyl-CoA hydratase